MSSYPHLYRNTTVGVTLQETLDDMIQQGSLTERAAGKILSEFDRAVNGALAKTVNKKIGFSVTKTTSDISSRCEIFLLQGKLNTYRFCDSVWTFVVKDFAVKDSATGQHNANAASANNVFAEKVRIVACEGKSESKSNDFLSPHRCSSPNPSFVRLDPGAS